MVELDIDREDVENLLEFFDLQFFQHLKNLLDIDELDNMNYLKSMTKIYDELIIAKDTIVKNDFEENDIL